MTKRAKRYSGRIASTAVVAAALGLIIWALIAFAAGSVTVTPSSAPLGTSVTSTLAGGFATSKYYAEYWGPTANGGTVMMRNYTAVVTSNGAGGATNTYTTNISTGKTGTWTARYAINPNYTRPQYIQFDVHSSIWRLSPKTNIYYGFKLVDRNGSPILTDQSSHMVIRLRANGSSVTGWNGVPPNSTNGWSFNPATGIYSRRDATSRASGVYLDLRVGAAANDTYMPGSGTAETGDAATFNTNMRYATCFTRVGSSSGYPITILPVYGTNTPDKNEIITPGATSYSNYTYYFDIMGSNGSYMTATTNLSVTSATAYAPLSSGGTTAYNSGTFTYDATAGHFRVRFNLPQPNKYGILLNITRSNYSPISYQVINYAAAGSFTVLPPKTPPDPVTNLQAAPGDRQIAMQWDNPANPSPGTFAGVLILRNASNVWPTPTDGQAYTAGNSIGTGENSSTVVYNNNALTAGGHVSWTDGESCNTQKMLQTGQTYYYRVISYDTLYSYCTSATAGKTGAQVPVDAVAPAAITGLSVTRQDRANRLTWTPSTDCDYYGVRIRATTNGQAAAFELGPFPGGR